MKKLLITFCLIIVSISVNAQNCLSKDSVFQNFNENLFVSKVIIIDSSSQVDLIKKVKNWGALNFVNFKEVLVSETDNLLVLNYISSIPNGVTTSSYYTKLTIQFKDGKVKVSFYDDGNVYYPASQYGSAVQARTFYVSNSFRNAEQLICDKGAQKNAFKVIEGYKTSINKTLINLENTLKNNSILKDDF
jgi:hypothetical protein